MNKKNMRRSEVYISGNNAVQLEGKYSDYKTARREKPAVKKQPVVKAKTQCSNPVYTLILTSVIIMTLVVTVVLLNTQFIVTDNAQNLITLKQELVEIRKTNGQLRSDLQKSVNMDEVYRIATEELGMVQATQENIKYVQAKDLTYTVQYADIHVPDEKAGMNIGNILGFISKGW
ncbi:MAG: hypothetical protein H7X94_10900 [Vallitaleaceae bacterium]|nr:hypothetical protein [Vallitaleaceae bacterium]